MIRTNRWAAALALGVAAIAAAAEPRPAPRLGVNLDGVSYWSPAWVFVDAFKMAGPWIAQRPTGGPWDTREPLALTPEGWVARLNRHQTAGTLMRRSHGESYPAGRYVCLYEGKGRLHFRFAA